MTNDLLPCPFCGTADLRTIWTDFGVDDTPVHVSIACNECLAELPPCLTEDQAIAAWNTRANKPAEVDAQKAIDLVDLMIKLTEPTPDQTSCICFNETHSGHDEIEWTLDDWKTIRAALSGHLATGKGGDLKRMQRALIECTSHANLVLHSPRNDDGTHWINGGMSSVDEIFEKILSACYEALTEQQKTAEPCGDAVAWQVYNELVKEWTSAYADKVKADQLVKDGYKIRPLYAEQQPAAPTQIDAVELEAAFPDTCDGKEQDAFEAWAASEKMDMSLHPLHYLFLNPKTAAARDGWRAGIKYCRAHLEKSRGGV